MPCISDELRELHAKCGTAEELAQPRASSPCLEFLDGGDVLGLRTPVRNCRGRYRDSRWPKEARRPDAAVRRHRSCGKSPSDTGVHHPSREWGAKLVQTPKYQALVSRTLPPSIEVWLGRFGPHTDNAEPFTVPLHGRQGMWQIIALCCATVQPPVRPVPTCLFALDGEPTFTLDQLSFSSSYLLLPAGFTYQEDFLPLCLQKKLGKGIRQSTTGDGPAAAKPTATTTTTSAGQDASPPSPPPPASVVPGAQQQQEVLQPRPPQRRRRSASRSSGQRHPFPAGLSPRCGSPQAQGEVGLYVETGWDSITGCPLPPQRRGNHHSHHHHSPQRAQGKHGGDVVTAGGSSGEIVSTSPCLAARACAMSGVSGCHTQGKEIPGDSRGPAPDAGSPPPGLWQRDWDICVAGKVRAVAKAAIPSRSDTPRDGVGRGSGQLMRSGTPTSSEGAGTSLGARVTPYTPVVSSSVGTLGGAAGAEKRLTPERSMTQTPAVERYFEGPSSEAQIRRSKSGSPKDHALGSVGRPPSIGVFARPPSGKGVWPRLPASAVSPSATATAAVAAPSPSPVPGGYEVDVDLSETDFKSGVRHPTPTLCNDLADLLSARQTPPSRGGSPGLGGPNMSRALPISSYQFQTVPSLDVPPAEWAPGVTVVTVSPEHRVGSQARDVEQWMVQYVVRDARRAPPEFTRGGVEGKRGSRAGSPAPLGAVTALHLRRVMWGWEIPPTRSTAACPLRGMDCLTVLTDICTTAHLGPTLHKVENPAPCLWWIAPGGVAFRSLATRFVPGSCTACGDDLRSLSSQAAGREGSFVSDSPSLSVSVSMTVEPKELASSLNHRYLVPIKALDIENDAEEEKVRERKTVRFTTAPPQVFVFQKNPAENVLVEDERDDSSDDDDEDDEDEDL